MARKKKPNPVREYLSAIGRRGGEKKVRKGAALLSAEEMKARASKMSVARWGEYYRLHPEKLKAKREREAKSKGSNRVA